MVVTNLKYTNTCFEDMEANTTINATKNQTERRCLFTRLDHVEKHTAIYINKYHACSIECQYKKK
jgi:hypothetical protein